MGEQELIDGLNRNLVYCVKIRKVKDIILMVIL